MMKKIIIMTFVAMFCLVNSVEAKVISNEKIDNAKVETASKIIARFGIVYCCLHLEC